MAPSATRRTLAFSYVWPLPLRSKSALTFAEPLEKELAVDQAASLQYIDALCEVKPPLGFEEYFGTGPLYRWIDDGGQGQNSMLERVRQLPLGETPEDVMRALRNTKDKRQMVEVMSDAAWLNQEELMAYLYETLDANPEIVGVVGYSEGACIAASLILDEAKRYRDESRTRRIRCGVFFTGWPPLSPGREAVLSDESSLMIDVPTLHIIGANDPYKAGGLALYNVCEQEKATLFDTGRGHTVPRAGLVIQELGDAVRELIGVNALHSGD